jgi:HD-like signal output (HDOD) protein/CheY-like chemotaxis protein
MPKRRLKALVVDDEKSVRSLVIGWLFREGFLCNEAEDGSQALQEINRARYDLVVTDLRMPNRHGHSLCQAVLDAEDRPRLVVLTGVDDPRIVRDLESRGVDHIFKKPINPPEFVNRIRELTQSCIAQRGNSANQSGRDSFLSDAKTPDGDDAARLPSVAVLLHDLSRAQALATLLKHESILPFVLDTTDALCRLAESRHLDLLVLEDARFGFLGPKDLVGHLKSAAAMMQIVLVGNEGKASPDVSTWATAPKWLPATATDPEIVLAVRGKITSLTRFRSNISAQARELTRPFANLSSAQRIQLNLATHLTVAGAAEKPDRLAADVMADPELTADILRLANGASAGVRGQVSSVADAISRIGVARSAALLVSSGIKGAEKPMMRRMSSAIREWYQRRSTLNAVLTSVFAQKCLGFSGDCAFILGLLQDLGIAVLAATFEDRYARLVSRARSCGPTHLHVVEREDLRIDHSEVSAALMEQWGFPEELSIAVRTHHSPKPADRDDRRAGSVTEAMRLAESVADLCDNRHPSRRQEFLRQFAACAAGKVPPTVESLEQSPAIASELAQQFRIPLFDEASLKSLFRDVCHRSPA